MAYCEAEQPFPKTELFKNATVACGAGHSGTTTQQCIVVENEPKWADNYSDCGKLLFLN